MDIDYVKILGKAKDIALKQRWLWVIGILLAMVSSGSGNSNFNSSNWTSPSSTNTDTKEKAKEVLGAATTAAIDAIKNVPVSTWLLIGLVLMLLVVVWAVVSVIIRNWSKSALIGGISLAEKNDRVIPLTEAAPIGFRYTFKMFKLSVISGLIMFGTAGLCFSLMFIPIVVKANGLLIFLGVILGLCLIPVMLVFGIISIFSERFVVLQNISPWNAWKRGLKVAKKHFFPTAIMGCLGSVVGSALGCAGMIGLAVVLGIPAVLVSIPLFTGAKIAPWQVISYLVLFIIFINATLFANSLLLVFKYSTWHLFVKELLSKTDLKFDNEN